MALLPGSSRTPAPGVDPQHPVDLTDYAEATLLVRHEPGAPAAEADLAAVRDVLTQAGLEVEAHASSGRVHVSGTVGALSEVFGTTLHRVEYDGRPGRHRTGDLSVPDELDGIVVAVLGLDDRPQARAQFRPEASPRASYSPVALGSTYRFPQGTDGAGQHVAIVELGGGFVQADLDTYFAKLGVGPVTVRAHDVDGVSNQPGKAPQGADGEVMLDIEVVGALAPKAVVDVYFAPNTDRGFLDAVSEAVHATSRPAAVSISWGQSEDQWTAQGRTAMDQAFADAAALGVTVCCAAGDNGSADGQSDGKDHCDFPASSPHALACGGTSLHVSGGQASETVWNNGAQGGATGGGISDTFPQPAWQQSIAATAGGRGVPDVAGDADPQTGYEVLVDGTSMVIGGTSAVAPLWAALVARLVQELGPLGLLQPRIYGLASGFRDITEGSNGTYSAGPGWDACTGLGSPDGEALLAALRG